MKLRCVLFDFDFTLADSSDPICKCVRYALDKLGCAACTDDQILRTVGLSLPEMFRRLAPGYDGKRLATLFIEKADEIMVEGTTMFQEVPAALRSIRTAGVKTGIVSTKFRHRIERILTANDLLRCFDVIVGAEDVERHKPDPDGLLRAMAMLGSEPPEALYVGDSLVDAEAARRAGVAFCAVLHGTTTCSEFQPYAPVSILSDLSELKSLVARYSAA